MEAARAQSLTDKDDADDDDDDDDGDDDDDDDAFEKGEKMGTRDATWRTCGVR